jgi:hypothetical protein
VSERYKRSTRHYLQSFQSHGRNLISHEIGTYAVRDIPTFLSIVVIHSFHTAINHRFRSSLSPLPFPFILFYEPFCVSHYPGLILMWNLEIHLREVHYQTDSPSDNLNCLTGKLLNHHPPEGRYNVIINAGRGAKIQYGPRFSPTLVFVDPVPKT